MKMKESHLPTFFKIHSVTRVLGQGFLGQGSDPCPKTAE